MLTLVPMWPVFCRVTQASLTLCGRAMLFLSEPDISEPCRVQRMASSLMLLFLVALVIHLLFFDGVSAETNGSLLAAALLVWQIKLAHRLVLGELYELTTAS